MPIAPAVFGEAGLDSELDQPVVRERRERLAPLAHALVDPRHLLVGDAALAEQRVEGGGPRRLLSTAHASNATDCTFGLTSSNAADIALIALR